MRLIKGVIVGATALFIIITLFSLLIPSKARVSRVILISNTNPGDIYRQIANIENWKKWHPVFTVDSAELYCHPSPVPEADPGCRIVHHGRQIFIKLLPADSTSVKFSLHAAGEDDIDNDIIITRLSSQRSVQVEWSAITKLHWYPWDKFYGIFIDKLTGPGYEAALNGLKEYAEKSLPSPGRGI